MPSDEWLPYEGPPVLGSRTSPIDVAELPCCPGYLARMPSVIECMQATAALQHGELGTLFPNAPAAILDGAIAGIQSMNLYEAEQLKKAAGK